jgi:UDP-N-acetylglucosamine 3-dehydrogenase
MKVRVGVIGAGSMGSAHIRVFSRLDDCSLVAVCDIDSSKKKLIERYGCSFSNNIDDLLQEDIDAVSVCTPTSMHKDIALKAMNAGKHVFIEKPIAATLEDGKILIDTAHEQRRLLGVGYIERFNPAVQRLREIIDLEDIFSTVSIRFGPIPPSVRDIGVLLDLGTHEIDIMNYITRCKPEVLYAHISCTNQQNGFEDYAYLSLNYNKIHSHIEVSWLPNYKIRFINFYGNEKFYSIDYPQQTLKIYHSPPKARLETGVWQDMLWFSRNIEEDVGIMRFEPLELELKSFIKSIQNRRIQEPLCTGHEALEALEASRLASLAARKK